MSIITTRAILLRSFPYGETSRILRFYTDALGGVGVMGKGIRRGGGRSGDPLDSFAEGTLTVHVKATRDLQTLREFAPTRARRGLASDVRRFGAAAVLAELVLRHSGEDPNAALFDSLSRALDRLAEASSDVVVPTLLREGWHLVSALGYRPVIESCVECGGPPGDELSRFDFSAGGIRCARCGRQRAGPRLGVGARAQLKALLEEDGELPVLDRPRAHLRLLSDFVTYHLAGGRPLSSFEVLGDLLGLKAPATRVTG